MKTKLITLPIISAFLFSCASYRPILDENEQYLKSGDVQAERDIDTCMAQADKYLEKHKAEMESKELGRSAVGGAIIGGILGAVSGNGLEGAAGGAVVGAGASAGGTYIGQKTKDNLKPDNLKQSYATKCLERKKYGVIGWK